MGSFGLFEETAPRKTADNTAKHHDGSAGLVVANHSGGSESSVVVTTLDNTMVILMPSCGVQQKQSLVDLWLINFLTKMHNPLAINGKWSMQLSSNGDTIAFIFIISHGLVGHCS